MYKSPIKIIEKQMRMEFDDCIWKAVQDYAVSVDREELIKALRHDRDQYDKGYIDGKIAAIEDLVRCKDCKYSFIGRDGKLKCDILYPSLSWVDNDDYCSYGERRTSDD